MSYPDATAGECRVNGVYEIPNILPPKNWITECPLCQEAFSVRGLRHYDMWLYQWRCPGCYPKSNATFTELKPIKTRCPVCGATTTVTTENKYGACKNCKGTPSRRTRDDLE